MLTISSFNAVSHQRPQKSVEHNIDTDTNV
jgi:hypothetical protein